MIFSKVLRWLARRPQVIAIDLFANDRMALATRIMNLNDELCAALNWSHEERQRLGKALMARDPKGYDGWHPTDDELFTVSLAQSEWELVERLCSELVSTEAEEWQLRVLSRIRTKAV